MPASYPSSVYSPRTKANKTGVVYTAAKSTVGYAEDVINLDLEVVAIETELGASPKGSSADIAERIKGIKSLSDSSADVINIKVGNVGIGTATPAVKVVIAQDGADNGFGSFAQLRVATASDNNVGMNLGYDSVNDHGFIQVADQGISAKDLMFAVNNILVFGRGIIISHGSSPTITVTDTTNTVSTNLQSGNTVGITGTITNHAFHINTNNITGIYISTSQDVGMGTSSPNSKLDVRGEIEVNQKSKLTLIGGFAIKLTNKTGANSVAGEVVKVDTANDNAVVLNNTSGDALFGVFLDSGIADGAEAWVVISGIAEVKADAGGFTRGDRLIASTVTAGRVEFSNTPAVAVHFTELGHAFETAAANALGKAVLHFN